MCVHCNLRSSIEEFTWADTFKQVTRRPVGLAQLIPENRI